MNCPHLNRIGKKLVKEIHFIGCVRTIEGLIFTCDDCGYEKELIHETKVERMIDGIRI